MKQSFLSILFLLLPILAMASGVEINGVYYYLYSNLNTNTRTAEVTSHPQKYTGDVVIPESVTYEGVEYSVTAIGDYAFDWNGNLNSIVMPSSITRIGNYAFHDCGKLTSVVIPENVIAIGDYAFCTCSELQSIIIPNNVKSIGEKAFYNCSSLYEINLPQSVTSIGFMAFSRCGKLKSIDISSVTSMENAAFSDCASLANVVLSDKLTIIPGYAFQHCTALSKIRIPAKVESLGDFAFGDCDNLQSVSVLATIPPNAYENAFSKYNIPLIVPDGLQTTYQSVSPWNKFTSFGGLCQKPIIVLENGILRFSCDTEGVEYHYTISDNNLEGGVGNNIALSFTVRVYATKEGCLDSEEAVSEISPSNGLVGDVNGDGVVNAADVVKVTNIIMGE